MTQGMKLIVYPTQDLARSKALYAKILGVEPYADSPYYVGFRVGDQEIGLDPNANARGVSTALGYVQVADVGKSLSALLEAGAERHQDVQDVGGGRLIAVIKDASGNLIGLMQSS